MLVKSALLCLAAVVAAAHALPSGRLTFNFHDADADAELPSRPTPYNDTTFAKMLALEPPPASLSTANCPPTLPKFHCKAPTTKFPEATRVDRLRPGDISAIMAIGDSVTAGFAMTSGNVLTLRLLEDRGKSYSTGGEAGVTSLNNFLNVYNPSIVGSCTGTTIAKSTGKELNSAVSAARVKDLPSQVERLVEQLQTPKYKPVADKWKMLTVFIGANNVCEVCSGSTEDGANAFEERLRETLSLIHAKIPKVFVSLITIFTITQTYEAAQASLYCRNIYKQLGFCPCAVEGEESRRQMDEAVLAYNERTKKVAQEFRSLNDPQFTVSLLPGVSGLHYAQWGQCYLSNFDCFHPNKEANSAFALSFWNNLFEPYDHRTTAYDPYTAHIYCPSDDEFFI